MKNADTVEGDNEVKTCRRGERKKKENLWIRAEWNDEKKRREKNSMIAKQREKKTLNDGRSILSKVGHIEEKDEIWCG